MKKACISIVTEKLQNEDQAKKLALDLLNLLPKAWELISIERYHKFEDSFKIELEFRISERSKAHLSHYAITVTDSLFSPWLVFFDSDRELLELIFNKTGHSQFAKTELSNVIWAHWQFTE